jgi:hypothetical protein
MPLKITATTKFEAKVAYPSIRSTLLALMGSLEGYNADGPYPFYNVPEVASNAPYEGGGEAEIDFTTDLSELEVAQKSASWLTDVNNWIKTHEA